MCPILFLIYINDIKNSFNVYKFYFFTDDTSLLITEKKIKVTEHLLNWLEGNELTSSLDESNVLMFKRSRNKDTDKINLKTREAETKGKKYS